MRITAIAVGLAALAGGAAHAQSQLNLYGLMDAYVASESIGSSDPAATTGSTTRVDSGGMSTSYWGISGSEVLLGELKAVFALESFMRIDTGRTGRFDGDPLFSRNAFVGLEGGFGRVVIGRNTTPYFVSTIVYNPFGDSFVFSPAVAHTYRNEYLINDSTWNNSVLFTTPAMQGLRANLVYSSGPDAGTMVKKQPASWGGSLDWSYGALGLNAAFQSVELGTASPYRKQDALLLSGTYDFKVVRLFAQYQHLENGLGSYEDEDDMVQLGASVPLGRGAVLVSYANSRMQDNDSTSADVKRDSWALAYRYDMSRRTDAYLAYYHSKRSAGSAWDRQEVLGLGLRYRY